MNFQNLHFKISRSTHLFMFLLMALLVISLAGCSNAETKDEKKIEGEKSASSGEATAPSDGPAKEEHEDGPPETRQGAHDVSEAKIREAMLQTLDDLLVLEKITVSLDALEEPLDKKALDQYTASIQNDQDNGRYKVRDFQDIKLSYYNFTAGVAGITVEYNDRSFYADLKTNKPLTEKSNETRRLVLASEKIDGKWRIVAFFDPTRKPGADTAKGATTTSVPEAVKQIEKDLGY